MSKNQLTTDDYQIIKEFNDKFEAGLDALEKAKQLQVGDYLVLYLDDGLGKMTLQINSYGAPVKYKVVHSSKHGVPFIKKVSKKGDPIGGLLTCMGSLETDEYRMSGQKFNFELDPDYADSLLLQDQYDPSTLHKSKKDIWKSVTEHNKAYRIKTWDLKDVVAYFNTINIGDMLWTSNTGSYFVQDKKVMSAKDFNDKASWKNRTSMKGLLLTVLSIRDKNGKVRDITADFFQGKALYKERPRSYRELNI